MSDQEDNMHNNEEYEENYEENENMDMEEMNPGEEQYAENMDENGEEEGQDLFAFDIQINDDLYLLVFGKTEENKLLIRMIDKEDENKPFFQNELSLEDLRNVNPFFNNIDDENIVFQYIISNLNDADKEIKIVDEDKIVIILTITEEDENIVIPLELYKTMNENEGEEEENPDQEKMMMNENRQNNKNKHHIEEGDEQIEEEEGEIDVKNLKGNEEINDDHMQKDKNNNINPNMNINAKEKKTDKVKKEEILSSNLPLQIDRGQSNTTTKIVEKKEILNDNGVETIIEKKEVTKISSDNSASKPEVQKEITIVKETKLEPGQPKEVKKEEVLLKQKVEPKKEANIIQSSSQEDISLLKEELLKTINSLNENFNNQLLKQSESFKKMNEENENKLKEMRNELNKKNNELNDMRNKFDLIYKKMADLENGLKENKKVINGCEGKIKDLNNKINITNDQINNMNSFINQQIENNNKKIKEDMKNLSKQMNEKLKQNANEGSSNVNNADQNELNELRAKMQEIEEQIGEVKNDVENSKNISDNNFKSFNDKINDLLNKKQNDDNNNENDDDNNNNKNNNLEEINEKLADFENVVNNFEFKIQNLEYNLKNINTKNVQNKNSNLNEEINNKLTNLENLINSFDSKIKNLEKNNNKNAQKEQVQEPNIQYEEKIIELENITKDIEARINDYDFDKLAQDIGFLMEKANKDQINDKINNLDAKINQIKEKVNKSGIILNKNKGSGNESENINEELINRMDDIEHAIQLFDNQFQKIEDQNNNNYNTTNNLDKRTSDVEKKLSNMSKLSEDLRNKTDTLFKVTKNLENIAKDLDSRTIEIMNNISKYSSSKENYNSNNSKNYEKLRNSKKGANDYPENRQKTEQMNSSTEGNIISKENTFNNKPRLSNQKNYGESNYSYTMQPGMNSKYNYIDSKIVDYDDIIFITNRIKEMHPRINNVMYNLVYRASKDGDRAADFHSKCDKIGPNITIIKTRKGFVFGGFTFKNWEHMPRDIDPNKPNLGSASRDSRAFGFSVNNQKVYNNEKPHEFAIWCNRNFGPTFKNNLFQIFDSCLRKGGYCSVRGNSHFGGQNYDFEISGGESRFKVEELEVYEVKI
jgi:hypothetical protein